LALGLLASTAVAYPFQARYEKMAATVHCHDYPAVISWHVHVTYMLTNDEQIAEVVALRQLATEHFAPFLGSDPICPGTPDDTSGRYDNGRLCMIHDHDLYNDTLGPFAIGEWSMWVPVHYIGAVVPWFMEHRGQFSLLVHPNTGCEYEDHSIWAQWTGSPWNLDMSIFTQWTQTEEFNHTVGDAANPTCLPSGQVCAFGDPTAPGFAPQVSCCSGLACNCAPSDSQCICK